MVNVGDALSAIIVGAMANLTVRHADLDAPSVRMAAVGTIGHGMRNGVVHFWGSGLDERINVLARGTPYTLPPDTAFRVHAMRGPFSAGALRRYGVAAPKVYGDPVYFLPRLMPMDHVDKTFELGVVLHLTELDRPAPEGRPKAEYARYAISPNLKASVRLITMYAEDSLEAIEAKVQEICSCKAVLSTSLHGVVIADAYGIPATWFNYHRDGLHWLDAMDEDEPIDHRFRDLYAGVGRPVFPAFGVPRGQCTDWEVAIRAVQDHVEPTGFDGSGLYDAFPGPLAVSFWSRRWPLRSAMWHGVRL